MENALVHLRQDQTLASLISTVSLSPLPVDTDTYLALNRAIISQQLSTKAANTIYHRFLFLFENEPTPQQVLNTDTDTLRQVGLSQQKTQYLQHIAQFAISKGMSFDLLNTMTDQQIIDYLTTIKGVGKWTVEMLLIFCLGREDVFPADDLGIQQAMIHLYQLDKTDKKQLLKTMNQIAAPWQPYRSIACRYLWRWKNTTTL